MALSSKCPIAQKTYVIFQMNFQGLKSTNHYTITAASGQPVRASQTCYFEPCLQKFWFHHLPGREVLTTCSYWQDQTRLLIQTTFLNRKLHRLLNVMGYWYWQDQTRFFSIFFLFSQSYFTKSAAISMSFNEFSLFRSHFRFRWIFQNFLLKYLENLEVFENNPLPVPFFFQGESPIFQTFC